MNLRHGPVLGLALSLAVLVACSNDGGAAGEPVPVRAAQLLGPSCAPVGATAQLQVDATVDRNHDASFRVLSVGCAPSCSAVLGPDNVIAIRSDLEGAATVQAVVMIDEGKPPPETVTTARVVQFVGRGACEPDAGAE